MKLNIYAENFRSYPKIDWELPDGLTLIDALNKDTGGSNMAGKTTLLDAWFWCRYGWLPKWGGPKGGNVDAVIRRQNGMKVGATLVQIEEQIGADSIKIERQRPSRLKVWKNGVEIPGLDQKGIDTLLGMSADRFLVCCYLPQKRRRSFYYMSDNDRMDLLAIVSGLEDIENSHTDSKVQRDLATEKISVLKSSIEIYDAQLKDLPSQITIFDNNLKEFQWRLKVAQQEAHQAELRLDELNYDLEIKANEEVKDAIDPLIDQVAELQTQIQYLDGKIKHVRGQMADLPQEDPKFMKDLMDAMVINNAAIDDKNRADKLRKESFEESLRAVNSLEGKCDHCKQELPHSERQGAADKHRTKAFELDQELKRIPAQDVEDLRDRVIKYQEARAKHLAEISMAPSRLKSEANEIEAKTAQKKAEQRSLHKDIMELKTNALRKWKDDQAERKRVRDEAFREVSYLEQNLRDAKRSVEMVRSQDAKIRKEITDAEKEIAVYKYQLDQALDLMEVFGPKGYRAVSFDGLIEKISDRAGQLLSVMTESLYSTRLEQVGTDSKGNQKLILKPVIIKGGQEVPTDDLSGGAEERVALAYDVAVAEAAGEGMPLLLDEVLGALDAVGKTEAMVLLEEVSKTRPVLVIDHASEFKAMFSQVVKVIYENEESRLEVA